VYLATADVSIAKKIARTVRNSSGGLRYVKALGMLVDGCAQVSMNLTNYKATAIGRVVEFIRREAARYGVSVASSELVGLIPEDALVDAAEWYLQLDHFDPEQILERRLRAALAGGSQDTAGRGNAEFLDALAAGTPTPGGGSAAAYTGAAAAALVAMVASLTIGKKKYAAVEAQMSSVLEQAIELKAGLAAAVEQDADAFAAVMQAFKMPKDAAAVAKERTKAIAAATMHAAQVPLQVARMAVAVMGLAEQVVAEGNLNAITDGGTAAAMAHAALMGAGYNVRVNLSGLTDSSVTNALLSELGDLEEKAAKLDKTVRNHLQNRGGLHLA
ncbi:MAG: cyclodeaminase/cyclohydrolase family protein, partial [Anaerolineales bacterium]|nr:cyclodeaminase/cyclohydrolase family protein [Anaerolineales bacterium]